MPLIILFFFSCSNGAKEQMENGFIRDGVFVCNKFDWRISIPKGYKIRNLKEKRKREKTGYQALKDEVPENYEINKESTHLIGFEIDKYNYFSSSFEPFGNTEMTMKEHQKFVSDLLSNTYKKLDGIDFEMELSEEKIGKYDFYIIQTKLLKKQTDNLILTQVNYNTKIDNNLFSSSINYKTEDVKMTLTENFKNSLKDK